MSGIEKSGFKSPQSTDKKYRTRKPGDGKRLTIQKRNLNDIPYQLVAAIDFGSTFSGYAFSTKFDYKVDPLKIVDKTWNTGGALLSNKTSTCILFQPDEQECWFGFDAEDKYADLMDKDQHDDWFFFRRFKMTLYEKREQKIYHYLQRINTTNKRYHCMCRIVRGVRRFRKAVEADRTELGFHGENEGFHITVMHEISRNMKLKAANGKEMTAMKVFTSSIKFLKDDLLKLCETRGADINMSDIRWVLTVPTIWNDRAKQFMRECAEGAGIPGAQLVMSLEAEAAAIFCKYLPLSDMAVGKKGNVSIFKPGSKYLVLDVGGGTVDITVHEVQDDLKLRELYMANGGEWGGIMVDKAFEQLLVDILGDDVFGEFKKKFKADHLELQRNFEAKKRSISSSDQPKIMFTLPISLIETFEEIHPDVRLKDRISSNKKLANNLTWKLDKMRIQSTLAKDLFQKSVQKIIDHVVDLLRNPEVENINAILLVGGYSECPMLQNEIQKRFPQKRLVIPNEAGLAVLKGAVINGHELEAVTERISRLTYGVAANLPFVPGKHDEARKFSDDGRYLCTGGFSTHVKIGESVPVGLTGHSERYWVMAANQTEMPIALYTTTNPDPLYIDEDGCLSIGDVIINTPDTKKGMQRGVDVEFTFGGAEIEVKAYDINTREEQDAYFNFL